MDILEELFKLQDKEYARFHCKLTPTLDESKVIGVRVPELRKIAKTIIKNGEADTFLNSLPHQYNEENMLRSVLSPACLPVGRACVRGGVFRSP